MLFPAIDCREFLLTPSENIFVRAVALSLLAISMCTQAVGAPSHPRWAVHWYGGKGDSHIDQPNCHPLAYFSADPRQFDYDSDLFGKRPADYTDKVESQRIGEIAGFSIYDVVHNISDGNLIMKMVLVERRAGEFCELFQQQWDEVNVISKPAYIVTVDPESVLATSDQITGSGNFVIEEYWTFDKNGPIALDALERANGIAKKLLPDGSSILNGGGFDIRTLSYSMSVWKKGDGHASPSGGSLSIQFALRNHQLVVLRQDFDPEPRPN